MTLERFTKIARKTTAKFWFFTFDYLTPEEANYIRETPTAHRNLERRIVYALAQSLLTPDQICLLKDLVLENPQSNLSETDPPENKPRKEAHP